MRILPSILLLAALPAPALADTRVEKTATGYQLLHNNQPYFIRGAGGDGPKPLLKELGGNSFRTWGTGPDTQAKLDEAQKLGLTVAFGLWLKHDDGFDYADEKAVAAQLESIKADVLKYKDHPAILLWSVGNEMEGYKNGDDPKVWKAVQDVAAFIKSVDKRPVMTVIAEVGGERVPSIHKLCPDIDIVGINSYGGAPSIPERYAKAAGGFSAVKPYILTEFGPPGTWEMPRNSWKVVPELTSTKKAEIYRSAYEKGIGSQQDKLCLGSYVFTWGAKQEATATWFGMFLHGEGDTPGARLAAVDTLGELWSGKPPANRCPTVEPLKLLTAKERVKPGEIVRVQLTAADPEGDPLEVKWLLEKNNDVESVAGETQPKPPSFPQAITHFDLKGATLKLPADPGGYWLYAFVHDQKGKGAAMANIPLFVEGPTTQPTKSVKLPVLLYVDGMKTFPYVWSGWMGNTAAIAMDENSTDNPRSGPTCMKCEYKAADGFAGIVWQSPANDWGDLPGGQSLAGATQLTFWARGAQGGEKVTFKLGILDKSKKHPDSDSAELPAVPLTKTWKQYTIPLAGKDLSQIKTGFCWTLEGQGKPVTFYLDDVRYEK